MKHVSYILKCLYTPHFLTPVGVSCIFFPLHPTAMTSIPIIKSAIPKKRDTKTAPACGDANTKNDRAIARFHMNPDGSLCYSVDVYHITGVLGSHIGTKNGTELADLINPYATMQFYPTGTIGAYPTASVNGTLTSGDIKAGIRGPPGK